MSKFKFLVIGLFLLLVTGVAQASNSNFFLMNSEWEGSVTLVSADGSVTALSGCSLYVKSEKGAIFSGTIEDCGDLSTSFSAIRTGSPGDETFAVSLGAANQVTTATVKNFRNPFARDQFGLSNDGATISLSGTMVGSSGGVFFGTLRYMHQEED